MLSLAVAKAQLEMADNTWLVRKQALADAISEHARAMIQEIQAQKAFNEALDAYQEALTADCASKGIEII